MSARLERFRHWLCPNRRRASEFEAMRILFWNLNRQELAAEIKALVAEFEPAFVVFSEDAFAMDRPSSLGMSFALVESVCSRVQVYTTCDVARLRRIDEEKYYSIQEVSLAGRLPFLLAVIHWKSRLYRSVKSQSAAVYSIANTIRASETRVGHQRTIFIGDMNVDPFNEAMVATNGLNATMSRHVAMRGVRRSSPFGEYPFFYNPMWSVYGDESDGPPGTYFRSDSEEVCYFWHAFDQVLVRPDLVPLLPMRSLRVINKVHDFSLASERGTPRASDHFPILFEFEIPETES